MPLLKLVTKEEQYFSPLAQMTAYVVDAACSLDRLFSGEGGDCAMPARRIDSVEGACDEPTNSIVTKFNSSFIAPFDREDIYMLSGGLGDSAVIKKHS